MGLPKGRTNNPSGRPRGSKNKINNNLREMVGEFLTKRFNEIDDTFDQLTPHEQARFLIELLNYSMPKYQATEKASESDESKTNIYQQISTHLNNIGYEPKSSITGTESPAE